VQGHILQTIVEEMGGLYFIEHLFSFMLTRDKEEVDDDEDDDDSLTYHLTAGFMKRNEIIPEFEMYSLPADPQKRVLYYNELLGIQYHFYLNFRKITTEERALIFSALRSPLVFELAKAEYKLLQV
jgi:hypothetical protein